MKSLNILDLQRKINQRTAKTTACFERVLEICHKKILFHCDRKHLRFFFEVPEYMFGYPLFDINDAIRYIVDALTKNGFLAIYYFPKHIYVSWDMVEIEAHKKRTKPDHQLGYKQSAFTQSTNQHVDIQYKPSGKLSMSID